MATKDDVIQALTDLEGKLSAAVDRELGQLLAKLEQIRGQVAPNLQQIVDEAKGIGERLSTKIDEIVQDAVPEPEPPTPEPQTRRA